jgi:excisionase family DNA binding protein
MYVRQLGVTVVAPEAKLLVSVEEAAALLSLGRTVTWALVRKNELRSVKVGKTRRVVVASLQEYVERLAS